MAAPLSPDVGEWIGHMASGWPGWALAILAILIGAGWLAYHLGDTFSRKEWWQDREKRLRKEATTKKHKQQSKAKKG